MGMFSVRILNIFRLISSATTSSVGHGDLTWLPLVSGPDVLIFKGNFVSHINNITRLIS